ncbi:TetR/AcrR family transcriptional regulator [Actinomycetaceae bacterium TAE3-ERU4]|nr:TetR/AcrR family transcriptional regulator [Actinomycetaceae bacterium TAE3-ERU4]
MADITKRALLSALKEVLKDKPLDKVTIQDIADNAGVSRMTFYYHFSNIYELLDWAWAMGATRAIQGKPLYRTWQQGFLQLFEAMLENKNFVTRCYHSLSREKIEDFLYGLAFNFIYEIVESESEGMNVSEEDKRFIANFYKFAFIGLLLEWIKNEMKEEPAHIVDKVSILLKGDIPKALDRFRKDKEDE